MPLLLGIDLGTTGCKAALYDDEGNLAGESYLEYGLITLSSVMIEQDALAWWDLTCRAVREALAAADARPADVRGLAVSSQGISFLLVNAEGQPLGNAINWLDSRAMVENEAIPGRFDQDRLFHITGKRASPQYVLPKLLWLRRHKPEAWGAAHKILMGHDYLIQRMCGAFVTDHSMAGGTMFYDLRKLDWCDEILDVFRIPRELLPEVRWAGTTAGELHAAAAADMGLQPGIPVVVGGQDQKCAALGSGIADGTATVSLGTASAIEQIMDRPLTDPKHRVPSFTFVQPERWVLEAVVGTSGGALRWYRDTVAHGIPYAALDEEAAQVPPGADGVIFMPHLVGADSPHWVAAGRGTFHGLSLATSPGHLTRAVLEGVAYQLATNLAVTQELAGPVSQIILVGGGARSALWRQIIADVCNRSIACTSTVEMAAVGAAQLAGLGCGLFATRSEAQEAFVKTMECVDPQPDLVPLYAAALECYLKVEHALLQIAADAC